jgi:hypothetical protein
MNIAIQGHPTRGKELISLLESFGGINDNLKGDGIIYTYYIDKNNIIQYSIAPKDYKVYTLEEFETQFPFKIGDEVVTPDRKSYKIIALENFNNKMCYKLDNGFHYMPKVLKPYKEMKEERNITLTLEKAKEWYNKGGDLKQVALQAFTEKELNPLPRSWEEFCKLGNPVASWRYSIPIKYDALFKLEQLRNCWWNGWEPKWDASHKYTIKNLQGEIAILGCSNVAAFLTFPTRKMAEEFFKCFRDLIKKAGDLI